MKGSKIKDIAKDWADEQEVFCTWYDKSEADDYIESNFLEDEQTPLTDDEWIQILRQMETDDGVWQELNNAWQYHINRVIEKRKGNNGNNQ